MSAPPAVTSQPRDARAVPDRTGAAAGEVSLWFLFWTFLKIGSVAFGGFMALISVVEDAVVRRRALLRHEEMLDGISLANLLPGPMAVNVVAFVGYRLRGGAGALAAAAGVILPSFLLLLALSDLYFRFGQVTAMRSIFQGLMPAVAAIVLAVVWRLARKTVRGPREAVLVVASTLALVLAPPSVRVYAPVALVGVSALLGWVLFRSREAADGGFQRPPWRRMAAALAVLGALLLVWFLPLPFARDSLVLLALTFASMSLMLFGGGYVFIPIIGSVVVLQYGWVTQQEFTDGIALGQITPGPILISATFIGYKVAGLAGAACATAAIFAPPALLMVTASQALDAIKGSGAVRAALHGIHCAVIGMILVAGFVILRSAVPVPLSPAEAWPAVLILLSASVAMIRYRVDVLWIIPLAGMLGFLLY